VQKPLELGRSWQLQLPVVDPARFRDAHADSVCMQLPWAQCWSYCSASAGVLPPAFVHTQHSRPHPSVTAFACMASVFVLCFDVLLLCLWMSQSTLFVLPGQQGSRVALTAWTALRAAILKGVQRTACSVLRAPPLWRLEQMLSSFAVSAKVSGFG